MAEEMIRCFIAIDIENQIIDQILAFQNALTNTGADVKLVEAENIHVTLRFLGEISPSLIDTIGRELTNLCFDKFEVTIQGIDIFPDIKRIHVVWLGIERGFLNLIDIHNKVESVLKKLSIRPDSEGFNPHITIARLKSAKNKDKLAEVVINNRDKEFGTFYVDSVKFKKSVLTSNGPVYTTIKEVKAVNCSG